MNKVTMLTKSPQRHKPNSWLLPHLTPYTNQKRSFHLWHYALFHLPATVCSIWWSEIILAYYKYFNQGSSKWILWNFLDSFLLFMSVVTGENKIYGMGLLFGFPIIPVSSLSVQMPWWNCSCIMYIVISLRTNKK